MWLFFSLFHDFFMKKNVCTARNIKYIHKFTFNAKTSLLKFVWMDLVSEDLKTVLGLHFTNILSTVYSTLFSFTALTRALGHCNRACKLYLLYTWTNKGFYIYFISCNVGHIAGDKMKRRQCIIYKVFILYRKCYIHK